MLSSTSSTVLGNTYDAFKTSFGMQHSIVAVRDKTAVSLATAIEAAEEYEFKH